MFPSLVGNFLEAVTDIISGESTSQPMTTNANTNTDTTTSEVPVAAAAATTVPQSIVRPTPVPIVDPQVTFLEAYDCAKLNNSWPKVVNAIKNHPDWLIRIPEGRRWTMLHQIVFSGDINHLNEILAFEINNPEFRLLFKTLDDKTVREVAADRAHIHPQMLRRIERLVASDQLLNNAKDNKWDLVKQCVNTQPDIINEKPPYRHFYLVHQLAYTGDLNMFKELNKKCPFKLDVVADNKTISQIAREQNHAEFAEHIENLILAQASASSTTTAENETETTNNNNNNSGGDDDDVFGAHDPDGPYHFSPGFYEDPGITFIPANINLNNLFPNSHSYVPLSTFGGFNNNYNHFATHTLYHSPHHGTASATNVIDEIETNPSQQSTSAVPKPSEPAITEEEQTAYEQKVKESVQNISHQNLLNSITCCITKNILRDPVIAADGFTYERQAILSWFQQSNRSPMTNEELDSLDLKPNYAIKSILQLLQDSNSSSQTTNDENTASSK